MPATTFWTGTTIAAVSLVTVWGVIRGSGSPVPAPQTVRLPVTADTGGVTPQQMVDAFHSAFGEHHARAVHAKGIMAEGDFTPSAEAAGLSKAPLFTGGPMPTLVRFSNFTGIPDIPDNIGDANPRGLALKFTMPGGATTDIVTHSFNGFPTATTAEFRELLLAIAASGAGAPKPTPIESFLAGHPIAKAFLTSQKPAPVSYTTLSYFGVNSFRFTNAAGGQHYVRYRFVPVAGEQFLPAGAAEKMSGNYLVDELPIRLAKGAVAYDWYAQIAEAGDAIENPAIAWPESRKLVKLGRIRIQRMVSDPATADKRALFMPANVPTGIEPADPMLTIRQGAYPISFAHRQ